MSSTLLNFDTGGKFVATASTSCPMASRSVTSIGDTNKAKGNNLPRHNSFNGARVSPVLSAGREIHFSIICFSNASAKAAEEQYRKSATGHRHCVWLWRVQIKDDD